MSAISTSPALRQYARSVHDAAAVAAAGIQSDEFNGAETIVDPLVDGDYKLYVSGRRG